MLFYILYFYTIFFILKYFNTHLLYKILHFHKELLIFIQNINNFYFCIHILNSIRLYNILKKCHIFNPFFIIKFILMAEKYFFYQLRIHLKVNNSVNLILIKFLKFKVLLHHFLVFNNHLLSFHHLNMNY